ncbi:MAG: exonuclease SbcC [Nitrosopumilus sp.]
MVFGWGKKKPKKESSVAEIPKKKEIALSAVPQVVIDLENLRKSKTINEIRILRNSTEPLITDLIKIGNVLEKDDLKIDDIDKHIAIIVVRGKKQVIDVIKKGVVSLPEISSEDDLEKLNSTLNQILKKVGDVLGRQTRVIHIFAKKYATRLKEILEVMNANYSEIANLIENYESTKTTSVEINDMIHQVTKAKNIKFENSKKIEKFSENIKSINQKILDMNTSIDKIKSSEDYRKYSALKKNLESFASTKSKIKRGIDEQFAKISRPLSRYEYGSSLDKDQKVILSKLVADPIDVLLPQNKDAIIIILENVRKAISSGSISVKDVEKSQSHITETEESLDRYVQQISDYLQTYEKMVKDVSILTSKELIELEHELTKNISLKSDFQTKSQNLTEEISEIDLKIPSIVSKIEDKLRRFSNTQYSVLLD